ISMTKKKIIKDRHAFETNFNRSFDGKEIRIIILQPVNMLLKQILTGVLMERKSGLLFCNLSICKG
ncbi:hypothetical protein DW054_16495, partial [Dorea formicigenerans]